MKRKIIIYILVCTLVFPTVLGVVASSNTDVVKSLSKVTVNRTSTHTILAESFTLTTCDPCKYTHRALKNLYKGGWHPFYYMTFVKDANKKAEQRYNELLVQVTPTVVWDGDYRRDEAAVNVEEAMARYNTSLILCENRDVADIDLTLNVTWQGAVDPSPANGATDVVVEKNMNWNVTAMDINFKVDNNEASQYNGHLHVYVTEVNSSYWDDLFGDPETFAFLDYAFNGDVSISAGGTVDQTTSWDGKTHDNGYGEFFDEINQDNAMVIASVFDGDTDYTDETAGFRAGVGTDPKTYDIYFGNTNPPPKVWSNTTNRNYNPPGDHLEFNTTYYWKIDVWDNKGNPKYGSIWHFTTRVNHPPMTPYNPAPANNTINIPINTNISWWGGDIDFDSVTYDVYFGENKLFLPKVSSNQSDTTYDPSHIGNLNFSTKYWWKIVAWDGYGLKATAAPLWNFITQVNIPPYPPSDPFPADGAHNVPQTGVILSWNGSDPNQGDRLNYCVYFGKDDPTPNLVSNNQTGTTYNPGNLDLYAKYYWQIVAWDSGKKSTSSLIWSFTTGINDKPGAPAITGLTSVTAGKEYEYTFNAIDPNGDDISYFIEWGDQTNTGWVNLSASGVDVIQSHIWAKKGDYTIRAKAKDVWGAVGSYGTLTITVPLNLQSIQQSLKPLNLKTLNKNTISFQLLARLMDLR